MFLVMVNTDCTCISPEGKLVHTKTRKDNYFEKHEVVADPDFKLAPTVRMYGTKMFGFERDSWTIFVMQHEVKYVD